MPSVLVWLLVAVYAVGYLMTWRTAAYIIADPNDRYSDGADVGMGIYFGGLIALAWPVIAPCYVAYRHDINGMPVLLRFLRVPAADRRRAEQLEAEKRTRDQDARIAQLERELDIHG